MDEEVLVLSQIIIKKKDSPGKFYKESTENRLYFNKFLIESRRNLDGKCFYWLKNIKTGKKIKKQVPETRIILAIS